MRLYCSPSTPSLGPQIFAYEAGAHVSVIQVDPVTGQAEDGRNLNEFDPFGGLPLLEIADGAMLREPAAILQAMTMLVPSELQMPDPANLEALRLLQWQEFGSGRLALAIDRAMTSAGVRGPAPRTTLARCLGWMDIQLGLRPYLLSDGYSIADIHIWALLYRGMPGYVTVEDHRRVKFGPFAHVQRWFDEIEDRAAVQAVLASESRIKTVVFKLAAVK